MPADLHFLRPQWFLALAPLLLVLFGLWRARPAANAWRGLVDAHLLPHLLVGEEGRPRRLPLALLALAWLIGVTALAGPVRERLPQPVFATSAKRVILLDLSPSMNAADLPPSRLARARFEVLDLLAATREGQVALIAFGPDPFIVSPLTGDARTIADQVPRLTTDLLPVPGPRRTQQALAMAGTLLEQAGAGRGEVILIADTVSDGSGGGTGAGTLADAAARKLAAQGHRLSVLGVGTAQGAPVPDADGGFAADRRGAIPLAKLDRAALEALARAGNGRYVDLDPGDRDTKALTAAGPGAAATGLIEQQGLVADQWREEGPWLLLVLLPIAALAFRRGWLLPVLALALALPPHPGWALGWDDLWQRPDQQAAGLLAGDAAAAAARFQDPGWRAAAHYRSGDYAAALADLADARGPEADYNRANALARLGRLDEAIAAYERTLQQVPDQADARANLDLVKQVRDRQKQSPPPDKPGDQGRQDKNDQPSQGDRKGQPDGPGQDGKPDRGGKQGQQGAANGSPSGAGQDAKGEGHAGATDQRTGADRAPPKADSKADPKAGQSAGTPDGAGPPAADRGRAPQGAGGSAAGHTGAAPPPPKPGELGSAEPEVALPAGNAPAADQDPTGSAGRRAGRPPDGKPPAADAAARLAGAADLSPQQRERQQALETQLQRVPDDPAGLLRQRFLLQQLRREGRLP